MDLGGTAMKEYSAFPQTSSINEASLSDCLVSYTGNSLRESYLFAEIAQSAGAVEYTDCFSAEG